MPAKERNSIMKQMNSITRLAIILAVIFGFNTIHAAVGAPPTSAAVTLVVDDDQPADFHTINGALAFAKAVVPDGETVLIRVKKGAYQERLYIDRSDTRLIAESAPRFDRDGYLDGYRNPVLVFVTEVLPADEDVVRIVADRVQFRGFLVWGGGEHPQDFLNAGIRVTGHVPGTAVGERIVRDVLISECEVKGIRDTPFWFSQSEGRIERCRTVDESYLDVFVSGADFALGPPPHVEIVKNLLAASEANICLIGPVWELQEGHNTHGDGGHSALVENNLLLDATKDVFGYLGGVHLNLLLWGDWLNSPQNSHGTLDVVFRSNVMGVSAGAAIQARAGEYAKVMATGLITGHFENNTFLGAEPSPVANFTMRFFEGWFPSNFGNYVHNHAFVFSDPDGLFFPDSVFIDEGPARNGNLIVINP